MSQNFSLHEDYRNEESPEAGGDRAFGCTVGAILMVISAAKAFAAEALPLATCVVFAVGAVLLVLGIAAPSRLSALNRIWLKAGAVIAQVVNPIVLALLFFFAVTPMALALRIAGKKPLGLAPDRATSSYWIYRDPPAGGGSSMRQQF